MHTFQRLLNYYYKQNMIFNHSGMSSDANWCLVQKSDDVLKRFSESFVNLSGASISHQPQCGGSLREGVGGGEVSRARILAGFDILMRSWLLSSGVWTKVRPCDVPWNVYTKLKKTIIKAFPPILKDFKEILQLPNIHR